MNGYRLDLVVKFLEVHNLLKGCLKIKKSNLTKGYLYKKQLFIFYRLLCSLRHFRDVTKMIN